MTRDNQNPPAETAFDDEDSSQRRAGAEFRSAGLNINLAVALFVWNHLSSWKYDSSVAPCGPATTTTSQRELWASIAVIASLTLRETRSSSAAMAGAPAYGSTDSSGRTIFRSWCGYGGFGNS